MTSNRKSGEGVTIVTQTRVRPGNEDAFAQWQKGTSEAIARYELTRAQPHGCRARPGGSGHASAALGVPRRLSGIREGLRVAAARMTMEPFIFKALPTRVVFGSGTLAGEVERLGRGERLP